MGWVAGVRKAAKCAERLITHAAAAGLDRSEPPGTGKACGKPIIKPAPENPMPLEEGNNFETNLAEAGEVIVNCCRLYSSKIERYHLLCRHAREIPLNRYGKERATHATS